MIAQAKDSKAFELVMCVRDSAGKRTNNTKSFSNDSAYKVWEFFEKSDIKTRKSKGIKAASDKPEDILKAVGEYAEKKQDKRDEPNVKD